MTVTINTFRQNLPEFGATDLYPDAIVELYLNMAYQFLRPEAWHDNLDTGVTFFVAHNLVLYRREQTTGGSVNGVPGAYGVVSSKTVGSVSVSYDTHLGAIEGAADLNLSHYGVTFARLQSMMGMGAFVI
jgi:hypothetical protein